MSADRRQYAPKGWQLDGPVTATQVHQVERAVKVKVWEPVP